MEAEAGDSQLQPNYSIRYKRVPGLKISKGDVGAQIKNQVKNKKKALFSKNEEKMQNISLATADTNCDDNIGPGAYNILNPDETSKKMVSIPKSKRFNDPKPDPRDFPIIKNYQIG